MWEYTFVQGCVTAQAVQGFLVTPNERIIGCRCESGPA